MVPSPPEQLTLSPAEIDILCEHLGLSRFWFPLDIPSVGATLAERHDIAASVWPDLAERGWMWRGRLDADREGMLELIAAPDTMVSSLAVLDHGRVLRMRAVSNGTVAFVAHQNNNGPITIDRQPPKRALEHAVNLIGANRAGTGGPLDLTDLVTPDDRNGGTFLTPVYPPGAHQRRAARALLRQQPLRGGLFVAYATGHDGAPQVSPELHWFDTDQGRYVVTRSTRDGRQRVSCRPATNVKITELLHQHSERVAENR